RDGLQPQRFREAYGRLHDQAMTAVGWEILNEAAIDLQHVDRQAREHAQGGMARSEIVDRDRDAGRPQARQAPARTLWVREQRAFGHFELQALCSGGTVAEQLKDALREVVVVELNWRDVHGHPKARVGRRKPARGFGHRVCDDPGADLVDEAERFEYRHEYARRDWVLSLIGPAQERLHTFHDPGVDRDFRLIAQSEVAFGDRSPQLVDQAEALRS